MYQDIQKLKDAGYVVEERSPYHYQVMGKPVVNIWPSKKKFMMEWGSGASYYTDVIEAVKSVQKFDRAKALAYWQKILPVPAFPKAFLEWQYGLDTLLAEVASVRERKLSPTSDLTAGTA